MRGRYVVSQHAGGPLPYPSPMPRRLDELPLDTLAQHLVTVCEDFGVHSATARAYAAAIGTWAARPRRRRDAVRETLAERAATTTAAKGGDDAG